MVEGMADIFSRRTAGALRHGAVLMLVVVLALALWPQASRAKEAAPAAADPALEQHMLDIAQGLRCLVCQNQTIAELHADLAADLREEIRELLRQGKTDQQIRDYMTARYGDFVLYKPPVKSTTLLLWFGPALLLCAGLASLVVILRRRARLPDDAFEADEGPGEADDAPQEGPRAAH